MKLTVCFWALSALVCGSLCGQIAQPIKDLKDIAFIYSLERTEYIDLTPLELSPNQALRLNALREAWMQELAAAKRNLSSDDQYDSWSIKKNDEIERLMREILTPGQMDYLIFEVNLADLGSATNRYSQESKELVTGIVVPYALEQLRDDLKLSTEQLEKIKTIDREFGQKVWQLKKDLAKHEDRKAKDFDEKLLKVLTQEQRRAFLDLVGDPSKLAEHLTAAARISPEKIYASYPPAVVPLYANRFDQDLSREIDHISKSLVFRNDLEEDLGLTISQKERWQKLKEQLVSDIGSHDLSVILSSLGFHPASVERTDQERETWIKQRNKVRQEVTAMQARDLAAKAYQEAFELLTPTQRKWLSQVALQYLVAESGAKFPLRYQWVRQQVKTTAAQGLELDDLIKQHDDELATLEKEYVAKDQQLREQAEQKFYDVLTPKQKATLVIYLGPPTWEQQNSEPKRDKDR